MLDESLGSYYGTVLDYFVCISNGSKYSIIDGSALGLPFGYTDWIVLDFDEGIKFGSTDDELLGFTLRFDHGYIPGIDEGTVLVSYDGWFYGYNEVNHEFLFLNDSLGSDDGTSLGSSDGVSDQYQDGFLEVLALWVPPWSTNGLMIYSDMG